MGANWATFSSLQPQLTAGPDKDQRRITSQGTWVLRGVTQVWTTSAQGGIMSCCVQLCRLETVQRAKGQVQLIIQYCISPEYSWEGLMLKLKLQYFVHLM